jgi:hypothetical protein
MTSQRVLEITDENRADYEIYQLARAKLEKCQETVDRVIEELKPDREVLGLDIARDNTTDYEDIYLPGIICDNKFYVYKTVPREVCRIMICAHQGTEFYKLLKKHNLVLKYNSATSLFVTDEQVALEHRNARKELLENVALISSVNAIVDAYNNVRSYCNSSQPSGLSFEDFAHAIIQALETLGLKMGDEYYFDQNYAIHFL